MFSFSNVIQLVVFFKEVLLVVQLLKNLPAMQETLVQFLDQEDPLRRDRLPTPVFLGFPGGSDSKDPPAMLEAWV